MTTFLAFLIKPFVAAAFLCVGAVGTVLVRRYMKEGRLKSLLLYRFGDSAKRQ